MVQGTTRNDNEAPDAVPAAPAAAGSEAQNAPCTGEKALKRARRPDRIALIIWLVVFGGLFLYLVIELIIGLFTFRGDSP